MASRILYSTDPRIDRAYQDVQDLELRTTNCPSDVYDRFLYRVVDNRGACLKFNWDLKLAREKLEDLERRESDLAAARKNVIAIAAREAKRSAADAAALPGLKRDELACNEISERTRCRQLRERIADMERRLASDANSRPVGAKAGAARQTTNPTQAQPAAPPKPFTAAPTPLPKPPLTRPTARPRAQRRTVRARRVSSASSNRL